MKNIKPLTPGEENAYRAMIAIAHKSRGQFYTTADLLEQVTHNLDTHSQRRLGRKFAAYVKKNLHKFNYYPGEGPGGNHLYHTY